METIEGQATEAELESIFNDGEGTEVAVEATAEEQPDTNTENVQPESDPDPVIAANAVAEEVKNAEEPSVDELTALRQEHEKLQHKYKSDDGRIAALQRQVSDLQRVNDTLSRPQKAETPDAKPSLTTDKIVSDLYSGDEERAKAAVEAIATMGSGTAGVEVEDTVNRMVKPLVDAEKQRYNLSQEEVLLRQYPQWRETVRTKQFATWLEQRPDQIKQLTKSNNAQDAIELLNYYTLSNKPIEAMASVGKTPVEKIQAKRNQQLQSGTAVASKPSTAVQGGMPSDPDAVFDYLERNDPDLNRAYGR